MTKTTHHFIFLAIVVLLVSAALVVPALAAPSQPSPGVVRAVLFWMDGCPHCHYVLDEVLPPLQEKYGDQLEIRLIEVSTAADVDQLLQTAASFGIPKEQVGVPLLVIGDDVLIGSEQIPSQLPGLIEKHLAAGGVDYPVLDTLAFLRATATPVEAAGPVVHLLLFWTSDCHACRIVVAEALPPLVENYGEQLVIQYVDVVTGEDVDRFYRVAAAFGIPKEQADLPMFIIGDHTLIGAEQIPEELPGLVEMYMSIGGVELPDVTRLVKTASTADPALPNRPEGFILAIVIMTGMIGSLVYSGIAFARGVNDSEAEYKLSWRENAAPVLALVGLVVAAYLAYVETQAVEAICGPVGNCNAVQSSPYARLFGILPVGILGMIGYLAILVAWSYPRLWHNRISPYLPILGFGMPFFGVLLSFYLTFLELFVIKAICMWCITSAVIMTLLLLLSVKPAVRTIQLLQETDRPYANIEIETSSQ